MTFNLLLLSFALLVCEAGSIAHRSYSILYSVYFRISLKRGQSPSAKIQGGGAIQIREEGGGGMQGEAPPGPPLK